MPLMVKIWNLGSIGVGIMGELWSICILKILKNFTILYNGVLKITKLKFPFRIQVLQIPFFIWSFIAYCVNWCLNSTNALRSIRKVKQKSLFVSGNVQVLDQWSHLNWYIYRDVVSTSRIQHHCILSCKDSIYSFSSIDSVQARNMQHPSSQRRPHQSPLSGMFYYFLSTFQNPIRVKSSNSGWGTIVLNRPSSEAWCLSQFYIPAINRVNGQQIITK